MKLKKVLQKLAQYLDAEQRDQLNQYDSIKKVLKKLKTKRNRLMDKIELAETDEERKRLQSKLDVVHAQRRKGVKLLKELSLVRNPE
ncbi:MAG: hypothetical protein JKY24_08795 [Pseudomonadales bacterium]|nr:hypothetical protein [Pseudomonadales bacterium]